jgi:signal transduction histidine kinase
MLNNWDWDLISFLLITIAAIASIASQWWWPPRRLRGVVDRAFLGLPAAWLLASFAGWLVHQSAIANAKQWVVLLAYHALCVTAAIFLLACVKLSRSLFGWWISAYAVLGTFGLLYGLVVEDASSALVGMWAAVSLLSIFVMFIGLVIKLKNDNRTTTFLVAAGGLWGLSLVTQDLLFANADALLIPGASASHVFFFAFLVFLWLALTGRVNWAYLVDDMPYASQPGNHGPIAALSSFQISTHLRSSMQEYPNGSADMAVADERHRIAQDIHDGVGGQLVALLGSLNEDSPLHRRMRVGLECCLLDLKTTVDNIDASGLNIFEALGSLRYRIAPALQRAKIRMVWKVELDAPLITLNSQVVAQIQRIAQECFANVLIHSEATKVRLQCRYVADPTPHLLMEVQDDGVGFVQDPQITLQGKGLGGMYQRAKAMGAELNIATQVGKGTRVRLTLPMH